MLGDMTSPQYQSIAPRTRSQWGPTWARVLAWIVLLPAAWALFFGVAYFIQGFGDDALAALGLLVGPILVLLATAVALPAVLFLVRRGTSLFIMAMCATPVLLAAVVFLTL